MAKKPQKDNDWVAWALIVFLFAVGLSPLALLLLFLKLFKGDDKKKELPEKKNREPERVEAGQTNRARQAVSKVTRSPAVKKSNARKLEIAGAVIFALGLISAMSPLDMILSGYVAGWIGDLVQALCLAAAGGALFAAGTSMDKAVKRYGKYLVVMGDRDAVPVEELARTLGYPQRRVEKDLQKMIDKGYFGGKAYLHAELGHLLRGGNSAEALLRQRQAAQIPTEPPKEAEEGCSGILRNIRRANDRIADPVLSAKIDRIEEITARIFQAVEADPQKRSRIDTFMNYYLPTTQKLLDSYAQFEQAGVEGENLRQAKQRIEATMDTIVKGFEHQLDELYKSDALDVDSDIRVLETMLRWDTASTAHDFGLDRQTTEK
ncbi:5-bromo-4-chloroindolyl phosphate hydrolysis family protein [Dysosmobacter sp.]|uniref:5-bromo-4-chloroindolyl phosphate hydrolysis family protein n=1 Tax=Dysosmobacter sp. TaxID=2591382 RepID=UPI002A9EE8C8|nr:5-bromo-4-chloroindolyl phosphate hydrolysis family protein [Dysosmobacter sp.]MDY5612438.1 5-bromo-4-chloroindolyl phosphate hydrolysis family protein [Dysosmobacter sp.]